MRQVKPQFYLEPRDAPAVRLCTRDGGEAQQWCNEYADEVGSEVDLVAVEPLPYRVTCPPIGGMDWTGWPDNNSVEPVADIPMSAPNLDQLARAMLVWPKLPEDGGAA